MYRDAKMEEMQKAMGPGYGSAPTMPMNDPHSVMAKPEHPDGLRGQLMLIMDIQNRLHYRLRRMGHVLYGYPRPDDRDLPDGLTVEQVIQVLYDMSSENLSNAEEFLHGLRG